MDKLELKSNLTQNEIKNNFKDINLFEGIKTGLKDALDFENGNLSAAKIRKRKLPDVDVGEFRKGLNLTQKEFAKILGVSTRTVEAWECGKNVPTPTAKNLMYLISLDNTLIRKLQK